MATGPLAQPGTRRRRFICTGAALFSVSATLPSWGNAVPLVSVISCPACDHVMLDGAYTFTYSPSSATEYRYCGSRAMNGTPITSQQVLAHCDLSFWPCRWL